MKVLHCDRCHKIIPNVCFSTDKPIYKITQLGESIGPWPPDDKRIDLCADCEKEFTKWLKKEEQTHEEK